jgi:hypothetical protein
LDDGTLTLTATLTDSRNLPKIILPT